MRYQAISTDSHVNEPPDLWQTRLPQSLRARGYRMVECEDGGHGWTVEDRKATSFGLGAVAGKSPEEFKERGIRFEDLLPGNWDPIAHLKDQDIDGVDASVIYPGAAMSIWNINDPELRKASMRAYNDWLTEDFAAADPKRIISLAVLPVDDEIEEAIAELERSVKKGHRGALIPTFPERQYTDAVYEPLWNTAEALDVPLHYHRGLGRKSPSSFATAPSGAASVGGIVLRYFAAMDPLSYMIFGGVFHRHPKLKLVTAESDFGWIPFWSQLCDDQWNRQRYWSKMELDKPPSEYIKRQVYATFMDDVVGCENLRHTGTNNIMWASDYPHSVTTWPTSTEYIERQMKDVPSEDRYALLAGNAVRIYHLS